MSRSGTVGPVSVDHEILLLAQQTEDVEPILASCWARVYDAGTALKQYLVEVFFRWTVGLRNAAYHVLCGGRFCVFNTTGWGGGGCTSLIDTGEREFPEIYSEF